MSRLKLIDVFTPTGNPTYTYVQRDDLRYERLLGEWERASTQLASVAGPSKVGKTVLVQRVIGDINLIAVSGASVRAPDQLWERVLDWWGEPHATTASVSDVETSAESRERNATLGIAGVGGSHKKGHVATEGTTEVLQATANRRGLPQVVQLFAGTRYAILLDDFHYIPSAIQSDVAQQLKDAASRGVRICIASVPHRADNVVRALPELRGRVLAIDLDYWPRKYLLQIPKLGLPYLNLTVDDASLEMFATEAAGSPQLMQSICLWTCDHLGVHETLGAPRAEQLSREARRQILYTTSAATDFRSLVRAMVSGPKVRPGERRTYVHADGRVGDVYLTVMRAIAADPPRLTIDYAELTTRIEDLCKGAHPDGASIIRACATLGQIAQQLAAPAAPSLEWDEQTQVLVLPDPYLLFYLRWSGILDEADEPR
jgi:hypothetical protein